MFGTRRLVRQVIRPAFLFCFVLGSIFGTIFVSTAPSALGFGNPRNGWPQAQLGDPVYLTYSYNNLLDGGLLQPSGEPLPASVIRASVEDAFRVWSEVAPLHFTEVADEGGPVRTGEYPDGQFGQIRFSHRRINGPDPPTGNPTTKAVAWFPSTVGNRAADIHFDNGDPWQVVGTTREPDVLGAAIHEIGHALGLTHSTLDDANMYWIFERHAGPGTG
ncbi:MAG: matrixin family metalloprotease, partial [Aeoliella sp.]